MRGKQDDWGQVQMSTQKNVRLVFSKKAQASYISQLALVRAFTRALSRAELNVKFTEGFNQRAHIVFGNPLSLGYESEGEFMDFTCFDDITFDEIKERLNKTMPSGLSIVECYEQKAKLKEIMFARYSFLIKTTDAKKLKAKMDKLFANDEVKTIKKGKNGEKEINIMPLINSIETTAVNDEDIVGKVTVQIGGGESLNPALIIKTVEENIDDAKILYDKYARLEFLNKNLEKFK